MKPTQDKSQEPNSNKAKTADAPADEHGATKVPESAENFEHVLRRLTIEKNKAKSRS